MADTQPSAFKKVAVFSTRTYDVESFEAALAKRAPVGTEIAFEFVQEALTLVNVSRCAGASIVVPFVNDDLSAPVIEALSSLGVKAIAMRCAGYNNVDLKAAATAGITVLRVPAYSPNAVAEHAVALMMALNRHIKKAIDRSRHGNFDLQGLVGKDISNCTVGVIGTGKIGLCFARILRGFGATVLGFDVYKSPEAQALGVTYVESMDEILARCDVISLHCNLTKENTHMFDDAAFGKMKEGAMLINTSRGGLIDTHAAIRALKSGRLGALGLDVVEEEGSVFFKYKEREVPDELARLILFNNVIVTGHQAFLTHEALDAIASTTISNIDKVVAAAAAGAPVSAGPTVVTA